MSARSTILGSTVLALALLWLSMAGTAGAATVLGYWKFDEFNTDGNHSTSAADFQVIDSTGNQNQLHSYRSGGYDYTDSTDVPPSAMFAGSNSSSTAIPNSGLMFHEVAFGGNDFNLAGTSFTLEGYFKTDGDQSGAGRMEVLYNSQSSFSYLVNLNEGSAGALRFATGGSPYPQVNLGGGGGQNYADGQWYYFVARYDEQGAGQDVLTLATYDGTGALIEQGQALAPAGFNIAATSSNMSVGSVIHTTQFHGNLDEIRVSRGLVDEKWQLNNVRVAVDTFDNTHDYKAAGVAGTVWDGLLNAGGATTIATSNGPTTLGDGNLQISVPSSVNVGWDASHNNAPLLFRDVLPGEEFDAQLVVESTTFGNYSVAGLMVRLADPLSDGVSGVGNLEDFLTLTYDNFGGNVRNRRRSLDDGTQSDLLYTDQHQFMRITREGDMFSLYTRANDGDEWLLHESLSRPDLAGTVQVGLWYGQFGGGAGEAQLENFLLVTGSVPEPSTFVLAGLGLAVLGIFRRRRRT